MRRPSISASSKVIISSMGVSSKAAATILLSATVGVSSDVDGSSTGDAGLLWFGKGYSRGLFREDVLMDSLFIESLIIRDASDY